MSKSANAVLLAGVAAVLILVAAAYVDGTTMVDIRRHAAATFDNSGLGLAWTIGSIGVAGSILALGALAWRSRSAAVGAVYAIVGAFFACLPVLMFVGSVSRNDAPTALPAPIADAVTQVYLRVDGPLNAVVVIGAGMLIAGLAVLVRALRPVPVSDAPEAVPSHG